MTKRHLWWWFVCVVLLYAVAVGAGIVLRVTDNTKHAAFYQTYRDLIPLVIAIPAVWLGYCLQQRSSYLQQLRSMWSLLVRAVACAGHYTYLEKPTQQQQLEVLAALSVAIDEVRCVFANISEGTGKRGLYPFEPIKDMYALIKDNMNRMGTMSSEEREKMRTQLFALWRAARQELLKEFDRQVPTFTHSHWADPEQAEVYDDLGIPKKPS